MLLNNNQILSFRLTQRAALSGPLTGDYVKYKDGSLSRITYVWPDHCQTGGSRDGAFFLFPDGYCSYSGGLDSGIKTKKLKITDEKITGRIWFFNQGIAGYNRGIDFYTEFPVYEEID